MKLINDVISEKGVFTNFKETEMSVPFTSESNITLIPKTGAGFYFEISDGQVKARFREDANNEESWNSQMKHIDKRYCLISCLVNVFGKPACKLLYIGYKWYLMHTVYPETTIENYKKDIDTKADENFLMYNGAMVTTRPKQWNGINDGNVIEKVFYPELPDTYFASDNGDLLKDSSIVVHAFELTNLDVYELADEITNKDELELCEELQKDDNLQLGIYDEGYYVLDKETLITNMRLLYPVFKHAGLQDQIRMIRVNFVLKPTDTFLFPQEVPVTGTENVTLFKHTIGVI